MSLFGAVEVSISDLDGRSDVHPAFALVSDGQVQRDGAHVDEVDLICRDETYPPDVTYVSFQRDLDGGAHVFGAAALVRAADPGAPDTQVVQALKAGVTPLASLGGGNDGDRRDRQRPRGHRRRARRAEPVAVRRLRRHHGAASTGAQAQAEAPEARGLSHLDRGRPPWPLHVSDRRAGRPARVAEVDGAPDRASP